MFSDRNSFTNKYLPQANFPNGTGPGASQQPIRLGTPCFFLLRGAHAVQTPATHLDTILQLETQHEDLLLRLDELDKRVVQVLTECQAHAKQPPQESVPAQ